MQTKYVIMGHCVGTTSHAVSVHTSSEEAWAMIDRLRRTWNKEYDSFTLESHTFEDDSLLESEVIHRIEVQKDGDAKSTEDLVKVKPVILDESSDPPPTSKKTKKRVIRVKK